MFGSIARRLLVGGLVTVLGLGTSGVAQAASPKETGAKPAHAAATEKKSTTKSEGKKSSKKSAHKKSGKKHASASKHKSTTHGSKKHFTKHTGATSKDRSNAALRANER